MRTECIATFTKLRSEQSVTDTVQKPQKVLYSQDKATAAPNGVSHVVKMKTSKEERNGHTTPMSPPPAPRPQVRESGQRKVDRSAHAEVSSCLARPDVRLQVWLESLTGLQLQTHRMMCWYSFRSWYPSLPRANQ